MAGGCYFLYFRNVEEVVCLAPFWKQSWRRPTCAEFDGAVRGLGVITAGFSGTYVQENVPFFWSSKKFRVYPTLFGEPMTYRSFWEKVKLRRISAAYDCHDFILVNSFQKGLSFKTAASVFGGIWFVPEANQRNQKKHDKNAVKRKKRENRNRESICFWDK